MDNTVKTRPNHYEVLGLSPGASDEEIAEAFAREIRAPRAFGGLAEVGIAYGVLRDPEKRRAYDAELGLRPEPEPIQSPAATVAGRGSAHFMGPAVGGPAWQPAVAIAEPHVTAQAEPETPSEPKPEPSPNPEPQPFVASERVEPRRQAAAAPSIEQLIEQLHAARQAKEQGAREVDHRPTGLSRTAATIGALVIGTMLLGAWAGLEARDDGDAQPVENSASVKLPPAKPHSNAIIPSAAARPSAGEELRWTAAPVAARPRRVVRTVSPPREAARSEDRLAEISQSLESSDSAGAAAADGATGQAAAEAPLAQTAAASMPLPNKVVARTIARIGYPCGEVASTSAVEGASGVYKVTCTSGHSYQAKPVRGRYHFRRLGSR